jgi:D-glycero-D-manno-heptose 1,7-bisphosphate phosphatase
MIVAQTVVFLDRDGVLVQHVPLQLRNLDDFGMEPGSVDAVARLNKFAKVFVTTNQRGVGLGWTRGKNVDIIHGAMEAALAEGGAHVDAIYQCRHAPFVRCPCAKPKPGMLRMARFDHELEGEFWMVGDQIKDARAAVAFGATTNTCYHQPNPGNLGNGMPKIRHHRGHCPRSSCGSGID